MTTTYFQSDTPVGIPGVTGADFELEIVGTATTRGTLAVPVAKAATETSYGGIQFTTPDEPPSATGTFTVEVDVETGAALVGCTVQVHRINSSGTIQTSSSVTAEQALDVSRTFTTNSVDLGAFSSGDWLRVDIHQVHF